MPSFEVRWGEGVTIEPFDDPDKADGSQPGRLNPRQNLDPLHARCTPGQVVALEARVFSPTLGEWAPPDSALDDHLFDCRIIERPFCQPPLLYSPFGYSSVWRFVAKTPGHYTVALLRGMGTKGRVIMHLSCEP